MIYYFLTLVYLTTAVGYTRMEGGENFWRLFFSVGIFAPAIALTGMFIACIATKDQLREIKNRGQEILEQSMENK